MICVVLPAYNEAENLQEIVPRIHAELSALDRDGRIIVVDDGSTDETHLVMERIAANLKGVDYLPNARNRGKAAALNSGFAAALSAGADRIVMMDADGQDDPAELVKVVGALDDQVALVTGARLVRHDRFVKRHTSRLYNGVTRRISGAPGRDFNSGFKAMRAEVARDVSPMLYGELHRYLTVIAYWLGYRTVEVPVQHRARMHGASKYGLTRFWRGFVDLLTIRFLMSYEHRPSHLFGAIGFTSFVLGVGIMTYLTALKISGESIGDRPLLLAGVLFTLLGLQLLLFGLLAELIVYLAQRRQREI